jgi:hypothetical protein
MSKMPATLDEIDTMEDHSNLPWNKLEKTFKLKKLYEFADRNASALSEADVAALKTAFKDRINRKQLQKAKEVNYNKLTGVVEAINVLTFRAEGGFSFKNTDNASPLTALAPKNKTVKKTT